MMTIRAFATTHQQTRAVRRDPFVMVRQGETYRDATVRHRRETGYLGKCVLVFGGLNGV